MFRNYLETRDWSEKVDLWDPGVLDTGPGTVKDTEHWTSGSWEVSLGQIKNADFDMASNGCTGVRPDVSYMSA